MVLQDKPVGIVRSAVRLVSFLLLELRIRRFKSENVFELEALRERIDGGIKNAQANGLRIF
jgi:hypothetical protein